MARWKKKTTICPVCKEKKKDSEVISADLIRKSLAAIIRKDYPKWSQNAVICLDDLNEYRIKRVKNLLVREKSEVSNLENRLLENIKQHRVISRNIYKDYQQALTLGEKLADRVAEFGGSWTFVSFFMLVLIAWVGVNVYFLAQPFDPYPFILLNLFLSMLAAIQAPIIMMSQNRQSDHDRIRSEHDYMVNLKAELEIRNLSEKIDHLLKDQWRKLTEIQQLQMEIMKESSTNSQRASPN